MIIISRYANTRNQTTTPYFVLVFRPLFHLQKLLPATWGQLQLLASISTAGLQSGALADVPLSCSRRTIKRHLKGNFTLKLNHTETRKVPRVPPRLFANSVLQLLRISLVFYFYQSIQFHLSCICSHFRTALGVFSSSRTYRRVTLALSRSHLLHSQHVLLLLYVLT